ncbi:MAG: nitroreductase family deazaflavin-dependent oxidoreductase [Acidimicrobiia bacterium]
MTSERTLFGQEHVEAYEATDGETGYMWRGVPTLILSTTGSVTGKTRKHPLIFGRDDDRLVVVASKGGAPDHPQWYYNLTANPTVTVQVKGDRFQAKARTATPEERERLWPMMTEIWPSYDDYQERTDRQIPLVILEPED